MHLFIVLCSSYSYKYNVQQLMTKQHTDIYDLKKSKLNLVLKEHTQTHMND